MRRSYSHSRRNTLERCMRQYFYDYYATAKNCPLPADRKQQVAALKLLSGTALLAGNILHRFARLHVDPSRKLSASWVMQTALKSFDEALEFDRDPRGQAHRLRDRFPPAELVEFSYEDLDGERAAGPARTSLQRALNALLHDDGIVELLQGMAGFERTHEGNVRRVAAGVFAVSQLSFSSRTKAHRYPQPLREVDAMLRDRVARDMRGIR